MVEETWSGFTDGDIELVFAGETLKVHRAKIAAASPVWKSMVTERDFAESNANTIHFHGDDLHAARRCIAMVYFMLAVDGDGCNNIFDSTSIDGRRCPVTDDDAGVLDEFIDKYELGGVKRVVTHEREMENRMRRLEADMKGLYRQIQIQDRQIQTLFHKVHQLEPEVERLVDVMRSRLRVIQEK
ncbi:MAG: BTB/POZ domain-containing protein [Hyphomicrobiales bacterium]